MNLKFYSHEGIPLKDHLELVSEISARFIQSISTRYNWLINIAKIIGKCHDFGKYTSFFQRYLLKKENFGVKAHHSLLSALFTFYKVKDYLSKNYGAENSKIDKFIPLISYMVVNRHHGDLRSPEEIIPRRSDLRDYPELRNLEPGLRIEIKTLNEQLEDIKKNFNIINQELNDIGVSDLDEFLKQEIILKCFKELDRLRYDLIEKNELSELEKIEIYFITILLFSVLIDADKKTAGREKAIEISRKEIPDNLVDKFIQKKFKDFEKIGINKIRNEIYSKVVSKINKISLGNKIFTLTAPTGSGKTLTALSFALKLREKIKKEKGLNPRIIYSLPFINIIEQNHKVFEETLSLLPDFSQNISSYLLKHHHLSNLEYKESNEFKSIDEALLLIESWESEIIITTFVQFLHTIIGFKNSFLKKFIISQIV